MELREVGLAGGDAREVLEGFEEAEVESEAGSVSEEHSAVATGKASEAVVAVNLTQLLSVRHFLMLSHLRSGLEQIKHKGYVCVASM